MERREFVENRPAWEQEYGPYASKLGFIGSQVAMMSERVPELATAPLRVLDIGCAYGMQLRLLKALNPRLELFGIEVARAAADAAREVAGKDNIAWQGCGDPFPHADSSLDLVFSFDMIEHVADTAALERMAGETGRALKPGGFAFIETPNYNRRMQWLHRLTGQGHMLKYDHCNLFGERRLHALLSPHLTVETILHRGGFDPGQRVPLVNGIFSPRLYLSSHICAVCRRGAA
jgi:SAM-dependent methyltransferase